MRQSMVVVIIVYSVGRYCSWGLHAGAGSLTADLALHDRPKAEETGALTVLSRASARYEGSLQCPMDAAATGTSSNVVKRDRHSAPRFAAITLSRCDAGI